MPIPCLTLSPRSPYTHNILSRGPQQPRNLVQDRRNLEESRKKSGNPNKYGNIQKSTGESRESKESKDLKEISGNPTTNPPNINVIFFNN